MVWPEMEKLKKSSASAWRNMPFVERFHRAFRADLIDAWGLGAWGQDKSGFSGTHCHAVDFGYSNLTDLPFERGIAAYPQRSGPNGVGPIQMGGKNVRYLRS